MIPTHQNQPETSTNNNNNNDDVKMTTIYNNRCHSLDQRCIPAISKAFAGPRRRRHPWINLSEKTHRCLHQNNQWMSPFEDCGEFMGNLELRLAPVYIFLICVNIIIYIWLFKLTALETTISTHPFLQRGLNWWILCAASAAICKAACTRLNKKSLHCLARNASKDWNSE